MKKIVLLQFILMASIFNLTIYAQWRITSPTLQPRYGHSAVKLNDGRVLITGGFINDSMTVSSCEMYDPQTETWTEVAPMLYSHGGHSSVLLPNKKVLVAGGDKIICELYDPELNIWQLTDTLLSISEYGIYDGIMNSDGKFFLISELSPLYYIGQIFDFLTEQWTLTDTTKTVRRSIAVSQIDETVMVAGGMWGVRNCEVYNKNNNSWQQISLMNEGRSSFTATKLLSGNILVTGGESYRGTSWHPKETCEIFDTSTQVWNYVSSLNYARIGHQAVLLKDGRVLVVGGYYDWAYPRKETEIYDANLNIWEGSGDVLYSRSGFTLTALDDSLVLLVGGVQGGTDSSACELFVYEPTSVEYSSSIFDIHSYSLSQNYPNPFNPSTKISWQSPVSDWQTLKVYDVLGNEVATLVNEYKSAGSYEVEFNPRSSIKHLPAGRQGPASGIYFYQLKAGDYLETKKMILLK